MNDARGYPIQVGDIIAYPGRKGSACWLTPAVVTDIRYPETLRPSLQVHPVDPRTDSPYAADKPRWIACLEDVVRLHRPLPTGRSDV